MRKGFREKLKPSDVYQTPSKDAADVLAERLEKFVFSNQRLHPGLIYMWETSKPKLLI